MSDLVTGEAVVLDLRLAKLPSRSVAFGLDLLIQGTVLFAMLLFGSTVGFQPDDALAAAISILVLVAVMIGYPVTWETLTRGRTPGKYALGLRVVRDDGGPIRFRQALVRGLAGFFVDFWFLGLFGFVALVVSLGSRRGKRVGDLLAGTVVVRERMPAAAPAPLELPPHLRTWAAGLDLSRLPDDLALAARQYLGRVRQLDPAVRDGMALRLAQAIAPYVSGEVPAGMPPATYLTAVLAERRNRELARMSGYRQPPYSP